MTIRERLRNIKHESIATKVGVSRSFISSIISQRRTPSLPVLARLAAALDVSDAELGASVKDFARPHLEDDAPDPHMEGQPCECSEAVA